VAPPKFGKRDVNAPATPPTTVKSTPGVVNPTTGSLNVNVIGIGDSGDAGDTGEDTVTVGGIVSKTSANGSDARFAFDVGVDVSEHAPAATATLTTPFAVGFSVT
jgi:hypothetical protein